MFSKRKDSVKLVESIKESKITKEKVQEMMGEVLSYVNFLQTKDLIEKLQSDIKKNNENAVDEMSQGKNPLENRALLIRNRIYEDNLRRLAAYNNPLAQISYLITVAVRLGMVFKVFDKVFNTEKPDSEDKLLRLIGKLKDHKRLLSSKIISDSDLIPLLLNGDLLPFFDKLFDLYQFSLELSIDTTSRVFETSPVAFDRAVWEKNAEEFHAALNNLAATLNDTTLIKVLDLEENLKSFTEIFAKDQIGRELGRIESNLAKSDDQKFLGILFNGSFTTLITKLIGVMNEFENHKKLIASVLKPSEEFKQAMATDSEKVSEKEDKAEKSQLVTSASKATMFKQAPVPVPKPKSVSVFESIKQSYRRKFG